MLTTAKRIIKSGFVGFWRNAFVSLSSIFVMTVSLFVIATTMLINQLLGVSLAEIQDKVDINVYFVPRADMELVASLAEQLRALPEVTEVTLTTEDEALESFRKRHSGDELTLQALDELGDNPLGASLAIRASDPSKYEGISNFLEEKRLLENPQSPIIDRINFEKNRDAITKLSSIIEAVEKASFVTLFFLIIASVMITFNTIRLAIYTSREEISIMRLVGASNSFIRGPFMLQGIMYGLVSGVLALLFIYPVVVWLGPATDTFFQFNIFNYFVNEFFYIFGVIVGVGVAMGFVSSMMAISRYLKV